MCSQDILETRHLALQGHMKPPVGIPCSGPVMARLIILIQPAANTSPLETRAPHPLETSGCGFTDHRS